MGQFGYIDLAALDDAMEPFLGNRPYKTEQQNAVVPTLTEVSTSAKWR